MNIIKPQKLLLDNLTKIEDFIEETKKTDARVTVARIIVNIFFILSPPY